jgi:hypothetical protein
MLLAQAAVAQGDRWPGGAVINLATGISSGSGLASHHTQGRVGSGIEVFGGYRMNPTFELRAALGFTGIRVSNQDPAVSGGPNAGEDINEYSRSLRFGVEQIINFRQSQGSFPYLFFGLGVQETWVARTRGSLAGATFATLWNVFSDHEVDYNYTQYANSLDSWNGFLTAGVGWRFSGPTIVELRAVTGNHLEFRAEGLTTQGSSPIIRRNGTLILLSVGFRQ